ncbi:MAG TPA: hypothetical protein VN871_04950 [Mycobacterium sp.]|nr:hypothetical protein [Mycobacterium sp.]
MSRRLVALVALVAGVQFLTPALAAADPTADPGDVQTLTRPHPSQVELDERFLDDLGLGGRTDTCGGGRFTPKSLRCWTNP